MGTEYDAELEDQVEGLEAENEVLNLEVNRLTEKMDEMESRIEAKYKHEYGAKMRRVNGELMKELGVTKSSTDDIEMNMAMIRKKINDMRWTQPESGADAKAYVAIPLPATRDDNMDRMYDYMNMYSHSAPWERNLEPRKPEYQYYKCTIQELINDHANMMKAMEAMARHLARQSPSYDRSGIKDEEGILARMCEQFDLKILPHNKKRR